jgi:hypothetical protein
MIVQPKTAKLALFALICLSAGAVVGRFLL